MKILKFPRTPHLEGSCLQKGDDASYTSFGDLSDNLVVEEKLDGANSAISFDSEGLLLLQSRGHYLMGGPRERHFALFKTWANTHAPRFHAVLGARYVMYGEWLYAKHTVFYDKLPHYFMEFDVLDRDTGTFLATDARRDLLGGLPIMPVPVLHRGAVTSVAQADALVGPSLYKSPDWRTALDEAAKESGSRPDMVAAQTEDSEYAEGLYLKQENKGVVERRFKFVRAEFKQASASQSSSQRRSGNHAIVMSNNGNAVEVVTKGRHDPCIVPRVIPAKGITLPFISYGGS